jgi:hypothetical protein
MANLSLTKLEIVVAQLEFFISGLLLPLSVAVQLEVL